MGNLFVVRRSLLPLVLAAAALVASCGPNYVNDYTYAPIAGQPYKVSEAQGEVVGGRLYSFGGFDDLKACCTPTDRAYVYDPAVNRWSPIRNMPNKGATHAGMTTDGSSIFYAGGYIANAAWTAQVFGTRAAWRYDVARDTYAGLPDLPAERAGGQLEYLDGKLHYFGGTNKARTLDVGDHYVLDVAAGATAWTTAAPMPNPRHHLGSAVLDGKVYAVGGQHRHDGNLVTQASVHAYDPGSNTWTEVQSLPGGRGHISNATFALDGRIIAVVGELAHGRYTNQVVAYDPGANSWTQLTQFPVARSSGVGGPLDHGFLYSGGGTKAGYRAKPS